MHSAMALVGQLLAGASLYPGGMENEELCLVGPVREVLRVIFPRTPEALLPSCVQ